MSGSSGEPLLTVENESYDPLDIDKVRDMLVEKREMAVVQLCKEFLEHASKSFTRSDETLKKFWRIVTGRKGRAKVVNTLNEIKVWVEENPWKTFLLLLGFGSTLYKLQTIKLLLTSKSQGYIEWSRNTTFCFRFLGFVLVMIVRLFISTLVPPTSPAFTILISEATPQNQLWTSKPCMLLASTLAGAVPWLLDQMLACVDGKDFRYTMFMKRCSEQWPLTCWTAPVMKQVFREAGGGKTGASIAVITAHIVPFMGAQTTNMQRFFLPHPLDTILSQPFGMSEDLLSMTMAEGFRESRQSSYSWTALMVAFNWLHYQFSGEKEAMITAIINLVIGVCAVLVLSYLVGDSPPSVSISVVVAQCFLQLFATPLLSPRCRCQDGKAPSAGDGGAC